MSAVSPRKKFGDQFFCKFLNREITTVKCIDGYVNANSLNIKHSPCYKCSFGIKVRTHFASQ